jgi:hypothetical protein
VLQRYPVRPLVDERPEPGGGVVGHLVEGEQTTPRDAEDVGEQQLGVHAGGLDATVGQPADGVGHQRSAVHPRPTHP